MHFSHLLVLRGCSRKKIKTIRLWAILLPLWLACLWAAPGRADSVTLANGDRLTGEVQGLEKNRILFKTSYAGTVRIAWEQVRALSTEGDFEIEAETGRRYLGRIERVEAGVEVVYEDVRSTIPAPAVVAMIPLSDGEPPGFWQILNGAIDLGYSFARGNSEFDQLSVGVRGDYRREKYKLQGSATSIFNEQDDAQPSSRQTTDLRYDRFLGPQAFAFALTGFERNDRQRLNLRSRLGGGFGWKLMKSQRTELSLLGGFTFINEQFRAADTGIALPRTSSGEALAGFELEATRFNGIRFGTKMSLLPNLVEGGRHRVEYDNTVRVPVFGNMSWSLQMFDRFDSEPPLEVQRNDYGVVSAFGFTF